MAVDREKRGGRFLCLEDLRKRLFRAVEEGSSARRAAARFEVSASTAIKLMGRVRETRAARSQRRFGSYRKPLLADHEALLRELTAGQKDITLAEIRDVLVARGIALGSLPTI